ncbi:MAG: aminoacyl-tRNA hydrolase [Actinobacteria bacterium]|nr:aminoacyl-tRNA hydrolase [Actinomycetota bacterium]
MILITGLGNPGKEYAGTRHNAGFQVLDRLKDEITCGSVYRKFNSLVCRAEFGEDELVLVKPLIFMNQSGRAVLSFRESLGEQLKSILIIHDDIDIDLGQIKFKKDGGTAGHRGLESIVLNLGNAEFDRLRFGVGRPPGRMDAADYVLRKFGKEELDTVQVTIEKSVEAIKDYVKSGIDYVMNRYNT